MSGSAICRVFLILKLPASIPAATRKPSTEASTIVLQQSLAKIAEGLMRCPPTLEEHFTGTCADRIRR
jgi:hypothetical protein